MRCAILIFVTACSFKPGAAPAIDASTPDDEGDASAVDAPALGIDATMVAPCTVDSVGAAVKQDSVGGPGGGGRPDLVCPAGELPIGAAFEANTIEHPEFGNQLVVVTTHVRCGRIERTTANSMVTTATGLLTRAGTTCTDPVVSSGELQCPQGAAIVGLRGNESGGQFSSYNSVQILCAALATDGTVTTNLTTLDFRPITGDYSTKPETSICPSGTAATAFAGAAGCTQDQIATKCAPLACN